MERPIMQQKHTKRSTDTKRKPLKVVYISNPMKFVATPDEFRAVVQQLTGWQSNIVDVAEATGSLTTRIAGGSTHMETSIDQTCRLTCGPDVSASLEGYLYEGFANEYDMFGDLSSICRESLRL